MDDDLIASRLREDFQRLARSLANDGFPASVIARLRKGDRTRLAILAAAAGLGGAVAGVSVSRLVTLMPAAPEVFPLLGTAPQGLAPLAGGVAMLAIAAILSAALQR